MDKILVLIRELEREQADLKRLIDESIRDGEYLMAHYHSEAIGFVNRKLQTLRNLDDKNYDSKKMIIRMIKQSEQQLGQEYSDKIKDHFKREIKRLKLELEELEKQEKVSALESAILTENLDLVISRKLKGIRVVLKKSSDFALNVRRTRYGVKILIKNIRSLRRDYVIHDENIPHFFGLGFKFNEGESALTMTLVNRSKEQLLTELQMVISQIAFEIFFFKEFEGDSFIEIR